MFFRKNNKDIIQYLIITDIEQFIIPSLPPDVFKGNDIIDFIQRCPENIYQLLNPKKYFSAKVFTSSLSGHDIQFINYKDIYSEKENLINDKCIRLIFINKAIESFKDIYKILANGNDALTYFHFYNKGEEKLYLNQIIKTPSDFINQLFLHQDAILTSLNLAPIDPNLSVDIEIKDNNPYYTFGATRSNFFLINRIIGNFNFESNLKEMEVQEIAERDQKNALLHRYSWERQKLLVKQTKAVDSFHRQFSFENSGGPESIFMEKYPSLIMIFPFNNPDLKTLYQDLTNNEDMTYGLLTEQTNNYINLAKVKNVPQTVFSMRHIVRDRLSYLDCVGFLHATFSKSPVIRLPLKGKSLYTKLSPFRVATFATFLNVRTRQKIKMTIQKLGKNLKETLISPELEKLLLGRNGQIVAISDLPVEWIDFNGIPFAFTHDICRLPETSLHGILSLYAFNNAIGFTISKDIIKKTLVIMGNTEPSFLKWQSILAEESVKFGFNLAVCTSLDDLKATINDYKPDFLVFDCHGGYDPENKSTYLEIGNEKLSGQYVVENNIYAPLIFISACGTAPTYGTFNLIANAFFEAGAFSVTTTYMPVTIDSASLLYMRIIGNLSVASLDGTYKNWLSFLSHTIRTSSVMGAFLGAATRDKLTNTPEFWKSNAEALTQCRIFERRQELFKEMDERIKKLTGENIPHFSSVIPEYLFYSNLGRSDLIFFDSWKAKNDEKLLSKSLKAFDDSINSE
ncbi:MAG: CHAT domain-containing protein [Acidobacteriota bacterium]